MIKRYGNDNWGMCPQSDGGWVSHADHIAAIKHVEAEREELKKERDELIGIADELRRTLANVDSDRLSKVLLKLFEKIPRNWNKETP